MSTATLARPWKVRPSYENAKIGNLPPLPRMNLPALGDRVEVYRNRRIRKYSVRHKGLVVDHDDAVFLKNARFVVQPKGRERTRSTGVRNVHAWVVGERVSPLDFPVPEFGGRYRQLAVSYDPYKSDRFQTGQGEAVERADWVLLGREGVYALIEEG